MPFPELSPAIPSAIPLLFAAVVGAPRTRRIRSCVSASFDEVPAQFPKRRHPKSLERATFEGTPGSHTQVAEAAITRDDGEWPRGETIYWTSWCSSHSSTPSPQRPSCPMAIAAPPGKRRGQKRGLFDDHISGPLFDAALQALSTFMSGGAYPGPVKIGRGTIEASIWAAAENYYVERQFAERGKLQLVKPYKDGLAAAVKLSRLLADGPSWFIYRDAGIPPVRLAEFRQALDELVQLASRVESEGDKHLQERIETPLFGREARAGAPSKGYMREPVRILACLWTEMTGAEVSGHLSPLPSDSQEFAQVAARFVRQILMSMDCRISFAEVRGAIRAHIESSESINELPDGLPR